MANWDRKASDGLDLYRLTHRRKFRGRPRDQERDISGASNRRCVGISTGEVCRANDGSCWAFLALKQVPLWPPRSGQNIDLAERRSMKPK